jgi:crossover junction endodeoxyribonuclease RusA
VSVLPVRITIPGTPRPQGSMRLFRSPNGHEVAKYADTVMEWRRLVTVAVCSATEGPPCTDAVALHVTFDLPRPKGHYGTGRNEGALRASAPPHPVTAPDLDKLARAIGDAITDAGTVWADDAQVVELHVAKRYADGTAGCLIVVDLATR